MAGTHSSPLRTSMLERLRIVVACIYESSSPNTNPNPAFCNCEGVKLHACRSHMAHNDADCYDWEHLTCPANHLTLQTGL
eukprot:2593670-Amphidinium_carterae.2